MPGQGRILPHPGPPEQAKKYLPGRLQLLRSRGENRPRIPGSEWLLDNFFILEQALRILEEDLPADYYNRLPKTEEGWPRIQRLTMASPEGPT